MREDADRPSKPNFRAGEMPALLVCSSNTYAFPMQGTVISYIYDVPGVEGEVVNDMPREYRQHLVADVHNFEAVTAQVRAERTDVPEGSFVDWTR